MKSTWWISLHGFDAPFGLRFHQPNAHGYRFVAVNPLLTSSATILPSMRVSLLQIVYLEQSGLMGLLNFDLMVAGWELIVDISLQHILLESNNQRKLIKGVWKFPLFLQRLPFQNPQSHVWKTLLPSQYGCLWQYLLWHSLGKWSSASLWCEDDITFSFSLKPFWRTEH